MKHNIAIQLSTFFILSSLFLHAAVPLRWTVETSRLQPAVFDVVRGETLALEASFQSYGKPVATSNMTAFLCWQTNGMASAWWVTNACTAAALSGSQYTVARVLFTPEMDPGAPVVNAFIGLSSTNSSPLALGTSHLALNYRAAFTLRFRHGPGAEPNVIDQPPRILDLAHTVVVNPPWPTQADFAATTTVMRAELKNYVDGQITEAGLVTPTMTTNIAGQVTSNVVTKAYVESLGITSEETDPTVIPAAKSTSAFDSAVAAVVTNDVIEFTAWTVGNVQDLRPLSALCVTNLGVKYVDGCWNMRIVGTYFNGEYQDFWLPCGDTYGQFYTNKNATFISEDHIFGTALTSTRTFTPIHNALGLAYLRDVPSTNGLVSSSVKINGQPLTNDVTISAGVSSVNSKIGDVTLVASDVGAYPETSGNQLASQVATQGAHLNAEDAQFVSTNYDSNVNMPEAYVRIKLQQGGTNVWRTIWEEMRRWNAFCGNGFNWQTWGGFHTWSTNILARIEETSPKEYAFYDGTTGEVAPDGFFWISQPRIGICAGAGYQRYLDAGCAVWILESNGIAANIGGTTNGYFRISDEEGNTQFEIIKGDKQTIPAIARSMRMETVMGVTHWICDYAVTNALAPPVAKFCRNLGENPPVWTPDTDASCPCNVTWTPGVNTYTLEFWPKSTEPTMFCKSEYDRGGETRIRQAVPTEMQYIILNGTKYGLVPKTVNGELVMGLATGN